MSTLKLIEEISAQLGITTDEASEFYTEALWDDSTHSFLRGIAWLRERGFTIDRHPSEFSAHFQQECSPRNCNSGRCCS